MLSTNKNVKIHSYKHDKSIHRVWNNITVLEQKDSVNYIVKFGNVKCTAIFNWYNCQFYADDKYGIIKEN